MTKMDLEQPIKKYMKRSPIKVAPSASLGEVVDKMAQRDRDVIIVVDGEELKGIVTSHDLFDALKTYVLGKDLLEQTPRDVREMKIASVMKGSYTKEFMEACGLKGTDVCITLGEENSVVDAIRLMSVSGLDHVLVMGEKGIVGTLSDDDLIKAIPS